MKRFALIVFLLLLCAGRALAEDSLDAILAERWAGYAAYGDTDSQLFLTRWDGQHMVEYSFAFTQDRWLLSDVRTMAAFLSEGEQPVTMIREELISFLNGALRGETLLEDENENILSRRALPPLPNVLTEEEMDLRAFDPAFLQGAGYGEAEGLPARVFDALKQGTAYADCAYVDGILDAENLQFLVDRLDGARVLLCGDHDGGGWRFTESAPLPAGTTLGIENFTENLNLGGTGRGPRVARYADGVWGAADMLGEEYFLIEQHRVSDASVWEAEGCLYGDHPWSDITHMDWEHMPLTLAEARQRLDARCWATPQNPNPETRLNLRERPDRDSDSLGKFYNGTPVEVLEQGGEWTRVRIGTAEGYMMTRYLAFGDEMRQVRPAFPIRFARRANAFVRWQDAPSVPALLELSPVVCVGVAPDGAMIVWDSFSNRFGTVLPEDLWEGNG